MLKFRSIKVNTAKSKRILKQNKFFELKLKELFDEESYEIVNGILNNTE